MAEEDDEDLKGSFEGEEEDAPKPAPRGRGRPSKQAPVPPKPAVAPKPASQPVAPKQATTTVAGDEAEAKAFVDNFANRLPKAFVHSIIAMNADGYLWLIPFDAAGSSVVTLMLDGKATDQLIELAKQVQQLQKA